MQRTKEDATIERKEESQMSIKQALISVYDKTGIVEFAKSLDHMGIKIISSGGTAKTLAENKINCSEISQITGFPEILEGRVKTLNPKIHGGILAKRDNTKHKQELEKHSIDTIDLVVVNLYPFENTISKQKSYGEITDDIIENIDIGGVALLRAAAKNFQDVLVVCDFQDYQNIIENIKNNSITFEFRRSLASKAFRHTAYYDSLISNYFTQEKFPENTTIPLKNISSLRYGENPHQEAAVYCQGKQINKLSIVNAKKFQGKELSYNNYLDLESAWKVVLELENPSCCIVKHNNPCGCAEGENILDAYKKALACDPQSAFGGIVAFNKEVDENTATQVIKLFTECVIAPSYTQKAKDVFSSKKNLRVLEQPIDTSTKDKAREIEYRSISGGMLIQDKDNSLITETKFVTKKQPTKPEIESLNFAWKICKHVKSNAIVLVKGKQTMGIGAGQMSRIDALKIAIEKMNQIEFELPSKNCPLVLASDAFFPFPDVVIQAAKIGVESIIQPGGSIKDEDSIKAADENNIAMVFTGMRHFRH